jgi:hypothetical protein
MKKIMKTVAIEKNFIFPKPLRGRVKGRLGEEIFLGIWVVLRGRELPNAEILAKTMV